MDYISNWSQVVLIFLLSIFKYGFGLFTAVNSSLGFWTSILINLLGGAIGVWLFTYCGDWIKKKYLAYRYQHTKPPRFSTWNRFLIHFKHKFGLIGIAIFSPIILTIPIGVILALQITENKKKIFFFIFSGCIVWSWIFFLLSYFFDFNISIFFGN